MVPIAVSSQDHPKRLASFPCIQNIYVGSPISYSRLVVKVGVGMEDFEKGVEGML